MCRVTILLMSVVLRCYEEVSVSIMQSCYVTWVCSSYVCVKSRSIEVQRRWFYRLVYHVSEDVDKRPSAGFIKP